MSDRHDAPDRAADAGPEPAAEPVSRVVLADVPLPGPLSVAHVEIRRITLGPGVEPGAHTHNGPVVGTVVRGTIVLQVRGEQEQRLGPGEPFYEPADVVIEKFDAGPEGAVFDAYFLLTEGQESVLALI